MGNGKARHVTCRFVDRDCFLAKRHHMLVYRLLVDPVSHPPKEASQRAEFGECGQQFKRGNHGEPAAGTPAVIDSATQAGSDPDP